MAYTVGEMAKRIGVAPSTLRYYEQEGLLPKVERSSGGMRLFDERDYDWLQTIVCLKQTGMQLRDIRDYMGMTARGDETIAARLQLLVNQRETIQSKMAQLRGILHTLEFKCWLYELAKKAGTTAVFNGMSIDQVPEEYRASYEQMQRAGQIDQSTST